MFAIHAWPLTLQRFDDTHAHARDQVRVFTVSLFGATPARFAREVKVWAEDEVTAVRASFERGGGEDSVDEVCIPTAGECNRRRETRSLRSHEAVQNLVVEDSRDAKARLLNEPLLQSVGEDGSLARVFALALARNLPDAILHHQPSLLRREVAARRRKVCLRIDLRLVSPETDELRDLLFESHPAQQIRHAPLDRQARILIIRHLRLCLHSRSNDRCSNECRAETGNDESFSQRTKTNLCCQSHRRVFPPAEN